jgi:hypothetical protein
VSICVHLWFRFLPDHPFEFELGVFEVQDQADSQSSDFEVIQHLAAFFVGDRFDGFCVHDYLAKGDQVGHIKTNRILLVEDIVTTLLFEIDPLQTELHNQGILVNLLVKTVANLIENFKRATDDSMRLLLQQELRVLHVGQIRQVICVHLSPSVVSVLPQQKRPGLAV